MCELVQLTTVERAKVVDADSRTVKLSQFRLD
jgi:hypothetical protein